MAAIQIIDLGAVPDDDTGNPLRTGGEKINGNFAALNAESFPISNTQVVKASSTVLTADGTFQDTGLQITASITGIYLINVSARAFFTATSTDQFSSGRLNNNTQASVITNTEFLILSHAPTGNAQGAASSSFIAVLTASDEIELQMSCESNVSTFQISSDLNGKSFINLIRIA